MRLDKVAREYAGRVQLVERAYPLEVYGSGPPNRNELEQEWWLAAIQEPAAVFHPYQGSDWPATTIPAFEAVWCAKQQDEAAAHRLDLQIRRSFFVESINIGQRDIYYDLARESGLEMAAFTRLFTSDKPRTAVLEEGRIGKERYSVRGTPTITLRDGTHLHHSIAYPKWKDGKIVSVKPLECAGEDCYQATRTLFEQALASQQ